MSEKRSADATDAELLVEMEDRRRAADVLYRMLTASNSTERRRYVAGLHQSWSCRFDELLTHPDEREFADLFMFAFQQSQVDDAWGRTVQVALLFWGLYSSPELRAYLLQPPDAAGVSQALVDPTTYARWETDHLVPETQLLLAGAVAERVDGPVHQNVVSWVRRLTSAYHALTFPEPRRRGPAAAATQ